VSAKSGRFRSTARTHSSSGLSALAASACSRSLPSRVRRSPPSRSPRAAPSSERRGTPSVRYSALRRVSHLIRTSRSPTLPDRRVSKTSRSCPISSGSASATTASSTRWPTRSC
jgi:hypothetical protein